ncbi:hypothetical protein GN956_G8042 [Arapaima gigas]
MREEKVEYHTPVQCEDNPHGFMGVVLYDDIAGPIYSYFEENTMLPTQTAHDPYGFSEKNVDFISLFISLNYGYLPNNSLRPVDVGQVFLPEYYVYGEPVAPDHFYRASSVRPFTMPHSRYVDRQLPAMANGMVEGLYSTQTISYSSQGINSPELTANSQYTGENESREVEATQDEESSG